MSPPAFIYVIAITICLAILSRATHHSLIRYKSSLLFLQRQHISENQAKDQYVQEKANGEYYEAYPPRRCPSHQVEATEKTEIQPYKAEIKLMGVLLTTDKNTLSHTLLRSSKDSRSDHQRVSDRHPYRSSN